MSRKKRRYNKASRNSETGQLTDVEKRIRRERGNIIRKMRTRGGSAAALDAIDDLPTFKRGQVWSRLTKVKGERVLKHYAITRTRLDRGWLKVYTYYRGDIQTRPREFFLKPGCDAALVREFVNNEGARQYVDEMNAKHRRNLI